MKCDAFISYSHVADDERARALQRALQHIARPFYRRRALTIFRDETSLSANPALWKAIETALSGARFFILMASPKSAASPWCTREVTWWLANRSPETFLTVLTGGELVFDDSVHDFDWARTTALSSSLAGTFPVEPFYRDLRWAQQPNDLVLTNARFRAEVLPLAAALHGREPQELDSEDLRQFRRTRLFWRSAAAGLTLLTITSLIGVWIAIRSSREASRQRQVAEDQRQVAVTERNTAVLARQAETTARKAETEQRKRAEAAQRLAVEQRDEAVRQRNLAVARQLAVKAEFLQNDKAGLLPQSMLLAAESLRRAPSVEADRTLRRGLALLPVRVTESHYGPYLSEQGGSTSRNNRLAFFSQNTPENYALNVVEFSWDRINVVATWKPDREFISIAFDRTARRLALGSEEGAAFVWDLPGGAPRKVFDCGNEIWAVALSATHLGVACDVGPVHLIDLASGAAVDVGEKSIGAIGLAFSEDQKRLAVARANGSLVVWQTDGWKELFRTKADFPGEFHATTVVAFSPHGEVVTKAAPVDKILHVWDVKSGKEISRLAHDAFVMALDFSDDDRLIATASADGKARVFEVATGGLVTEVRHQAAVRSVRFAQLDSYQIDKTPMIVTASEDNTARVWRTDNGRELTRAAMPAQVGWALPRLGYVNRFAVLDYEGTLVLFASGAEADLPVEGKLIRPIAVDWSPADNAFVIATATGHSERLDPEQKRANAAFGDAYSTAGDKFVVENATWSADGRRLLMAGTKRLEVWDAIARRKLLDRPCDCYSAHPALSPDGSTVAFAESNKLVRVLRIGAEVPQVSLVPDPIYWLNGKLAVSRSRVAFISNGDVIVREMGVTSSAVTKVTKTTAKAIAFSPNQRWLAWAGGRPGVLEVATGREVPLQASDQVNYSERVLFSPDSSRVAIATEGIFAIWSVPDGRRLASVKLDSKLKSLAFSGDGLLLAAGSEDGTARVWRLVDVAEIARIESAPAPDPITGIALSERADFLLTSAAASGVSRVWALSAEHLVNETCRHVHVSLTPAEWADYAGSEPYPNTCPVAGGTRP